MKFVLRTSIVWLLLGALSNAQALTAKAILAKADAIRMPGGDAVFEATLIGSEPGRHHEDKATYEVMIQGHDKTLIKTLTPASDRGQSMLMLGRDLWIFMPDVSQPVRVAMQQRLFGQVSNGDLARANFVGDYTPSIAKQGKTFYELKLMAVSDDVTYGQVELWVEKNTFRPIRAAFYAASGRLLKVGHYKDYRSMSGVMRPSKLVFEDAIEKQKQSTIYYNDIKPTALPEKYFTKDYLKKLKY